MDYIIYGYHPNVKAYWQFLYYYLWTTHITAIFTLNVYYQVVRLYLLNVLSGKRV